MRGDTFTISHTCHLQRQHCGTARIEKKESSIRRGQNYEAVTPEFTHNRCSSSSCSLSHDHNQARTLLATQLAITIHTSGGGRFIGKVASSIYGVAESTFRFEYYPPRPSVIANSTKQPRLRSMRAFATPASGAADRMPFKA